MAILGFRPFWGFVHLDHVTVTNLKMTHFGGPRSGVFGFKAFAHLKMQKTMFVNDKRVEHYLKWKKKYLRKILGSSLEKNSKKTFKSNQTCPFKLNSR